MNLRVRHASKFATVRVEPSVEDITVVHNSTPRSYLIPPLSANIDVYIPYMMAVGMYSAADRLHYEAADLFFTSGQENVYGGNIHNTTIEQLWSASQSTNMYGEALRWYVWITYRPEVERIVSEYYIQDEGLYVADAQLWSQGFNLYMQLIGMLPTAYRIGIIDTTTGLEYPVA